MFNAFEKMLVRTNRTIVGLMMGVMFVLVFMNVVLRYCFGRSIATAEEISTFLMIWVTYLGAGLALREGRHAAIDLFQDLLPEKLRIAVRWALGGVILLFFLSLAYYGILFARFGWAQETIATQIPQGIPYIGIPLGALLFGLHLVLKFPGWLNRDWETTPLSDEGDLP
jgi:TRAP-type C4-dicarboxylate transport system permease small subunit